MEGKILVTGGAGFIGSHVVDALLGRGEEVIVVDNFNSFYDPKRKVQNILGNLGKKEFTLKPGNVEDTHFMHALFEKYRISRVVHLAAKAGVRPSFADPIGYKIANVDGTLNLLHCAAHFKVQNFIFASSSSVYGNSVKVPFVENERVDHQVSPYALTKRVGELFCQSYARHYSLPVSCLRFFTVYGPRGRPDMAPYLFVDAVWRGQVVSLYGDGSSRRDYTYVDDIVSGILAALYQPHEFEIYNLGNTHMVSLKDFLGIVETILGKKALIEYKDFFQGDVEITCADISKAHRMLGYSPKVLVEEGMRKFFAWYKENAV